MKKSLKILIAIFIILVIILIAVILLRGHFNNENEKPFIGKLYPMKGVIIRVFDNSLGVMGIEGVSGLVDVGFTKEGNIGFKQGQEIVVYFDGNVMTMHPQQLGNVQKIEIVKEKSKVEIPEEYVKFYYNSNDNIEITINELTESGITFSIKDKNQYPYEYSKSYNIYKKIKNPNYPSEGEQIGEDTENSTSGYTGAGVEYNWVELDPISDISSEETSEELVYNLPNIEENENYVVTGRKFNWSKLYGNLESGEYEFVLLGEDMKTINALTISIKFTIGEDGKISYEKPEIIY